MFWILKRTRLSSGAFFNAINNNLGSGGSAYLSNRNGNQSNVSRKGYSKLSTLMAADGVGAEDEEEDLWGGGQEGGTATEEGKKEGEEEGVAMEEGEEEEVEGNDSLCYTDYEMSDDSDYEESLTCNVCDRYFPTTRQLAQHQQKKRHFGCSACDGLFPSLMALEHHKEEVDHWSEATLTDDCSEGGAKKRVGRGGARGEESSDEEERDEDAASEEHERLLL